MRQTDLSSGVVYLAPDQNIAISYLIFRFATITKSQLLVVPIHNLCPVRGSHKVPHNRIIVKLQNYKIEGQILNWIKDFLKDRTQRVVTNGQQSDWQKVSSGIPQGSVLGPILFLIYINDFPEMMTCCIQLFADDSKLYTVVNNVQQSEELQKNILQAEKWADLWQMQFNASKCKQLHIGKHNCFQYYYAQRP